MWDYTGKSPFKLLVLGTGLRKGLNGIKVSLSLDYQLLFRKWSRAPMPDSTWKSSLSHSASSQVSFQICTFITTILWIVFAIPLHIMMLRTTVLNTVNLPIQGPYSESKSNSFNTKRAFSRFSSWSFVSFWSEEKINGCWMFGNWTQSKNWPRLVIAQTQTIFYIWSPNTLSHPRRPRGR